MFLNNNNNNKSNYITLNKGNVYIGNIFYYLRTENNSYKSLLYTYKEIISFIINLP